MQNNTVETLIAAAVVVVAATFLFFAYTSTHTGSFNGYDVQASLNSVDGIEPGADVRLHGIKIGSVKSIEMNPKTYKPVVYLTIRDDIHLSQDSTARIASSLLNGNPFLSVQPGHNGKMLAAGAVWKAN
jgi:phospholipid/cholesterol/gamma-HCH transport system substrate-binding protein